jgi:RNA polymerase sigma-70 factor (ECF subfamily)
MFKWAIDRIRSGDMDAFWILYDISCDRVYASIFHRTLDISLSEDIVSQVYCKALKTIKNFRGNTEGEFFSWILRIWYTTMIDSIRKNEWTTSLEEIDFEPGYNDSNLDNIDNKTKLEEVIAFMDTLSERERIILTYRIWDDMSYTEISAITWESVDNCKKIVSRTLEKIGSNITPLTLLTILLSYGINR